MYNSIDNISNHIITEELSVLEISYVLIKMENNIVMIFYSLLNKNQGFAFNTLDAIANRSIALFNSLFNKLNSQQKEDYRVHLGTKQTAEAPFILKNFYSNDKEGSNKLRTESSNTDNLGNESLAKKRKRADLDEFLNLSTANFFSDSIGLEEILSEYYSDPRDYASESDFLDNYVIDENICIEPAAKRQCTSVSFLPGYAIPEKTTMLNCDLLSIADVTPINNIVPGKTESLTVSDGLTSEEHTSDSPRPSTLERFNKLGPLEKICIEQLVSRFSYKSPS